MLYLSISLLYLSRYSVTYLDDSTLLLTLFDEHCIQSVNLSSLDQPDTYGGLCGSRGASYSGHRINDLRMLNPTGIEAVESGHVYFASWAHSAVYDIEVATDTVTMLSDVLPRARMMTYMSRYNRLVVAVDHGIMYIDFNTLQTTWLAGDSSAGSSVRDSWTASFSGPMGIALVSDVAIAVADHGNHRFVVLTAEICHSQWFQLNYEVDRVILYCIISLDDAF